MRPNRVIQDPDTPSLPPMDKFAEGNSASEIDKLKLENQELRSRLSKLSEASFRINGDLSFTEFMQVVINGARSMTGAQYGVLLTYDESGNVQHTVTSGITDEQVQRLNSYPRGLGLLGYLNEVNEPLRINDIASHPKSVGFPENHPPMKTFLGVPVRHHGEHVGNIFLTEKSEGQEFTSEDEETLVLFASQASYAISSARRYEEVQRAKSDLETLIDISPIGVAVYDAKSGAIVSYNQELRRLTGEIGLAIPDKGSNLPLMSFRRPDGRPIPLTELPVSRVMLTGETVRAEEIIAGLPDGRTILTLNNAAPIFDDDGEITSVVVTVQDMAPLEDLERVRTKFLGMVSQELRMPLATIKGSTAAIMDVLGSMNSTESLQLLRIIDQQADLMRSHINSLIELTQIEAGTLSIHPELSSLSELIELASREFRRTHAGAEVDADISLELPMVMADRERLSQVFQNLFAQVSRFSPMSASVQVSASLLDIYLAVTVSFDREAAPGDGFVGRSIHPGEYDQETTSHELAEYDLAFAYCRGIVEAHGGRIRAVRGDRGYGTVYTLTLPAPDEAAVPFREASKDASLSGDELFSSQPPPTASDRAKILLAVPNARTLGTVRRTLSNSNYSTIVTIDLGSVEGLLADEKPELIVLDLNSPEAEGLRLTRRLTSEYNTPIIVLSEKGDDESVVRAFDMGADDYVVKPFSQSELLARIKSSLRKWTYSAQPQAPAGYVSGNVVVNIDARTLTVGGATVPLTATEYKLLYELSSNAGRVLTQDELLQRAWGPEYAGEPQLLRSYIKSLRQKLGDNARRPTFIFTEHGVGYRMAKP